MNLWKPITESEPEPFTVVLLWTAERGGSPVLGFRSDFRPEGSSRFFPFRSYNVSACPMESEPTHWSPLPEWGDDRAVADEPTLSLLERLRGDHPSHQFEIEVSGDLMTWYTLRVDGVKELMWPAISTTQYAPFAEERVANVLLGKEGPPESVIPRLLEELRRRFPEHRFEVKVKPDPLPSPDPLGGPVRDRSYLAGDR